MTGHQPHPGMGITMMGGRTKPIDIAKVLEGIGVEYIRTVDPLNYRESVDTIKEAAGANGVRAIIFKSPCIAIVKNHTAATVDSDNCSGCQRCVKQLGCPALIPADGKVRIDKSLCTGCMLCAQICPKKCIAKEVPND